MTRPIQIPVTAPEPGQEYDTAGEAIFRADVQRVLAELPAALDERFPPMALGHSLMAEGAAGNGTQDDRGVLAIVDALDDPMALDPGKTFRVGSDITLSGRVIPRGGVLKPASGVTITLNGPMDDVLAPVFDTSAGGSVVIGEKAIGHIRPEWWGAKGDGSTDDTDALSDSFDATGVSGAPNTWKLHSDAHYLCTQTLSRTDGTALRIEADGSRIEWTANVDGIHLRGDNFNIFGRLRLDGPGAGSSTKIGFKMDTPTTTTAGRQVIHGLHVIGWDTGVYLINMELIHAVDWLVNFNNQNMLMHDGAFNTFLNCRFSDNQGSKANVSIGGASGVGNSAGANHCKWIQCEWLKTAAGQWALELGLAGYEASSHIFVKCDVERSSGAYGFQIRGGNNILIGWYGHDLDRGIRWVTGSGDLTLVGPRFTGTGFSTYTIDNANFSENEITLIGGQGLNNGGGLTRTSGGFNASLHDGVLFDALSSAPTNPKDGTLSWADGSGWQSFAGLYARVASNWYRVGGPVQMWDAIEEIAPSANQNDYNIGDVAILRVSPTSNVDLTGIANGAAGRMVLVHNTSGTNTYTLKQGSASSVAANRFALPNSADLILGDKDSALLWYDATSSRWRLAAKT